MPTHRHRRPLLLVLLAIALVSACATSSHRRATAPVRELPKDYDVSVLQRAAYDAGGERRETAAALVTLVSEALPRGEGDAVEHDPALDDVAAVVARTLADTEQLPATSLVRWLLWQAGVTGQLAGTYGGYGTSLAPSQTFDEDIKKQARSATGPIVGVRRFGVARVQVGGYVGQAIVVADSVVDLDKLTKTAAAAEPVTLAGQFRVKAADVHLYLDDGSPRGRRLPVAVDDDGRFQVSFDAPGGPGVHYVELAGLLGEDVDRPASQRWQKQAALFPLYVDTPLPTAPDANIREPAANPELASFQTLVLERYNAARAAAGVAPLELDNRLTKIAQRSVAASLGGEHHRDDADAAGLAASGLPVRRSMQIATRFEYLDEDLWEALRSPSMRATLLDPKLSRVGLAFARGEDGRSFVGRTLLVMPVGKLKADKERRALLTRLNKLLTKQGTSPVLDDDKLTTLAQEYAESVCSGERELEDTASVEKGVERWARGRYGSYGLWRVVGPYVDPTDRRNYKDVLSRPFSTTGIGVCQGKVDGQAGVELVVFLTAAR